jgi:dolichyl-phosphooligosaccharide-protein glycotransferase
MRESPMIGRLSKQQSVILYVLIGALVTSLVLRILPFFQMDFAAFAVHGDPDVWYNFRQIEVMVSDFPRYNWFDPMTAYPTGKYVDWGPLFPLIASALCIVTGAVQRVDFIAVSSWVPVLFGVLMVPVVFLLARLVAGWKAGVIAAVFIAVVSGGYFYRTMAGVVDHHCAEIFFTTVFCLCYLSALRKGSEHEIHLRTPASWKPLLVPSVLAGVALAAGLAVVPTVLLFAMILAVYTLFQYIWDAFHRKGTEYLLVTNGVISAFAIAGLAIVGFHSPVYSLATYSPASLHAFVLLFCGTAILQVFSIVFREKPWIFVGVTAICAVGCVVGATLLSPLHFDSGIRVLSSFFGQRFQDFPLDEQKPWSFAQMWGSFNIGIILAVIGLPLLVYRFWKRECPIHLFILVWGVVVLVSTFLHSRFDYYSAVIIVLSAAIALSCAFTLDNPDAGKKSRARNSQDRNGKKEKSEGKAASPTKAGKGILPGLEGTGTSLVLACMLVFCGVSVISDYSIVTSTKNSLIPPQWTATLEWLDGVAADTGVPYLGPYDGAEWTYPDGSYSILSWWDYGHWITFLSKGIPVTNPFQDNVGQSAFYFFAKSEVTANRIADMLDARYIITDWKMTDSKFPSMVNWYRSTVPILAVPDNNYYQVFLVAPGQADQTLVSLKFQPYYQTMVSRLQNFDGTMVEPQEVVYIEYDDTAPSGDTPEVSRYEVIDIETARHKLAQFESTSQEGKGAVIANTGLDAPVEKIDALKHYRLIYEQADGSAEITSGGNHSVKAFEHVKGARLEGEGLIEVTIQTNLGRTFVYRQESENGLFILPYSTKDSSYPVKTTGPYRLVSSGRTIEVSEQDVMDGATITE